MNAGEAVAVLVEEIQAEVRKTAWTDSSTAVSIITSEGGSWRTRHLRLRSSYARLAILGGVWGLNHMPGEKMIADIGTKALTSTRIETLKSLMGMGQKKKVEEKETEEKQEQHLEVQVPQALTLQGPASTEQAIAAVRLITLIAMMSTAKGEEENQEDAEASTVFHWMVAAYTVMVVAATVLIQFCWKVAVRKIKGETEESCSQVSRSRPNSQNEQRLEPEIPGDAVEGRGDPNQLPEAGEAAQDSQPPEACVAVPGGGDPGWARAGQVGPSVAASSSQDHDLLVQQMLEEDEKWEKEWRELERDEARIREELNTPGSALWTEDEPPEPPPGFDVYYTQYGAVYHRDRACGHLRGPRVGPVWEGRWCRTCQRKAGRHNQAPLPGKEILLGKSVRIFHTDLQCPKGRKNERTPVCQTCGQTSWVG